MCILRPTKNLNIYSQTFFHQFRQLESETMSSESRYMLRSAKRKSFTCLCNCLLSSINVAFVGRETALLTVPDGRQRAVFGIDPGMKM